MDCLFLVVTLAGQKAAIPAAEVESVIEVEAVTPIPRVAAHVAGLTALRSRVLTVIDCAASLDPQARVERLRDAVVTNVDGHPYALLVDEVEDVAEPAGDAAPLSGTGDPAWSRVASSYVPVGDALLPLVDLRALVAGPADTSGLNPVLTSPRLVSTPPEQRVRA
jgi:purine-binding chemotaxis protein CheW